MRTHHHRHRARLLSGLLAFGLAALLSACGDDDSDDGVPLGVDDSEADDSDSSGGGGSPESDVIVTVDGQEYVVTTVQSCTTEGDERSDLAVYGFAASGERVELTFSQQGADTSPTGAAAYYGAVGISSGEVSGQVTTDEPFAFLQGDRSNVSGAVTMESTGANAAGSVEVSFDITCP